MNVYDDGRRAMPKVPGMGPQNPKDGLDLTCPGSGSLRPTGGTDGYDDNPVPANERRTGARIGQAPHTGSGHAQRYGVRPWTGKGDEGGCTPIERQRMALDEAAGIAHGAAENALIAYARETYHADKDQEQAARRCTVRIMRDGLMGSGQDARKLAVADLVSEALAL